MTARHPRADRPRFGPGENVHHIQARLALEDREAWRFAALVHAGDGHIDVELDGEPRRYRCRHAADLARAVDELPVWRRDDGRVQVMVAERWHVLGLPV